MKTSFDKHLTKMKKKMQEKKNENRKMLMVTTLIGIFVYSIISVAIVIYFFA